LWNILEEPNLINTSEFEDLFSKTTTQTRKKPLSEAYKKKAKDRKVTLTGAGTSVWEDLLMLCVHERALMPPSLQTSTERAL